MITEAIFKIIITLASGFINPILEFVYGGNTVEGFFAVPAPLWDYVQYLMSAVIPILPLMIAFWVWRQIKS